MAVDQDDFLHLSKPLAPSAVGFNANVAPLTVTIQPQAILSILDHAVRRDDNDTQASRVIGALVGVRSEDGTDVEVRSTFAIPHTENEDQVEVDVEYQKNMLALTLRANPRESLLGWYTTSHELNSFSALIQNFFASPETGTHPHPAVHLTISTEPGREVEPRCYISAPAAATPERAAESCFFVQVPHRTPPAGESDRAALEAIAAARDLDSRAAPVVSDIDALARSLEQTMDALDRVSDYVSAVVDEEREPSHAIGQYLMNNLSLAPKVDGASIEHDFNNHVQDVLMVSYLANTIRTQIDLAQRLALANLSDKDDKKEGDDGKADRGGGGRGSGGKRGGPGGRGGGRAGGGLQREPREPREPRENGD